MAETTRQKLHAGGWNDVAFEDFREGVTIHWIRRFENGQPGVAFLKYQPGAKVPLHVHHGLETILVLEGTQSDESGDFPVGSYMLNIAGSRHSVWSEQGCVVLIQWDQPVEILQEEPA